MNTIDLKKPDPTVEEDGCGFYACRVIADDVDVEERDPATEATQLDQIEPEEDFDEWLARKGPDDPPEPEDEEIDPRQVEEAWARAMRLSEQARLSAEAMERSQRAHRRVTCAPPRSRPTPYHTARTQPRSRAVKRGRAHRATSTRSAPDDGGPAPASSRAISVAGLGREFLRCAVLGPEVGRG